VFEGSIQSVKGKGGPPRPGDVGVVFDRKDRFLAVGLYDPDSPLRLRILSSGTQAKVGPGLFHHRLGEALERRNELVSDPATSGYRVIHGEADGFSGLVMDRYGDGVVLKVYTPAWLPHLRSLLPAVHDHLAPNAVAVLASRTLARHPWAPSTLRKGAFLATRDLPDDPRNGNGSVSTSDAELPWGDPSADDSRTDPESFSLPFTEHGFALEAHPFKGHKTGFYLDQRENRRRLEEMVAQLRWEESSRPGPLRVLNVFSYTGGFSLYAARGGAQEVVSVDLSGPALAQARRHFEINKDVVGSAHHRTLEGDAFKVMDKLAADGERFDVVVVDPPSFAKARSEVGGALGAYRALTGLALALLRPRGLLVQASCSSRISEEDFVSAVHAGARGAGKRIREELRTGHALDHPVTFPEGHYLNCLFARLE
jgi:23S rRNA (cytosine1962-C5)-methyltransferase